MNKHIIAALEQFHSYGFRCFEIVDFEPFKILSHLDRLSFILDTVDSITPDKVRGLRDLLNSSAMDIMYYTSPLYRDEVCVLLSVFFSKCGQKMAQQLFS